MGLMKRYAEQISVELGFDGELNDEVLKEAQRRIDQQQTGETQCTTPSSVKKPIGD